MLDNFFVEKINYRKDINFLRGIAVIAVIFYHLDFNHFEGGWLGVDLFFFISGYLISNKLLIGLKEGKGFLKNFFKKRFQRLTPPLITLSLFTTLFSFNFLSPSELKIHIDSTFFSLTYLSNFYFSNLDFYNSPSNKYLTMLHTWSLSVEEQFYILLPFIFVFVFKKNKYLIYTLLSVFILSFSFATLSESINIFYNTLSRMWEFLFGALFMLYEKKFKRFKYLSNVGFILIILSITIFANENVNAVFPKLSVLLGTALFLTKDSNAYFVRNTPIQTIGTISYSLYLFHQPIIAFLNIQNDKVSEINDFTKLFFILFIFFISYLNWYFVEKKLINRRFFIWIFIFYLLIILFFALLVFDIPDENNILNIPNKLFLLKIKQDDILRQNNTSCDNRSVDETCFFEVSDESQTIYILGDSSLRTLSNSLYKDEYFKDYNLVHFTGNNCLFIFGQHPLENACPNKSIEKKNNFGQSIKNSIIIYGGRFPHYFSGEGFDNGFVKEDNEINALPNIKNEIRNTLEVFEQNNNLVILIYPIPAQGWNVQDLIFYKNYPPDTTIGYPQKTWESRSFESNQFLDSIVLNNLYKIYPAEVFCNSIVKNTCVGAHDGVVYYSDDDHLNLKGSNLIINQIKDLLNDINLPKFKK